MQKLITYMRKVLHYRNSAYVTPPTFTPNKEKLYMYCSGGIVLYTQKNYSYMGYIFFMLNAINIVKNGIVDFYYCICYIFYETLISVIVII